MNKDVNTIWVVEMPKFAIGIFILLNTLAISMYTGGTYLNNSNPGYSMGFNFLSDLGRTISFSNNNNLISSLLFNVSLILAGIVFVMFFYKVQYVFQKEQSQFFIRLGTISGICGGFSLAGVGITPSDLYLNLHIIFATWIFRFFLIAAFSYSITIWKSSLIENKYAYGYFIFTFSILSYIIISEFGPSPKSNMFALSLQVISQKVILFIFLFAVYIQTLGIRKLRIQ